MSAHLTRLVVREEGKEKVKTTVPEGSYTGRLGHQKERCLLVTVLGSLWIVDGVVLIPPVSLLAVSYLRLPFVLTLFPKGVPPPLPSLAPSLASVTGVQLASVPPQNPLATPPPHPTLPSPSSLEVIVVIVMTSPQLVLECCRSWPCYRYDCGRGNRQVLLPAVTHTHTPSNSQCGQLQK